MTQEFSDRGEEFGFETTQEIEVPERLLDQVIGQSDAREIVELAAHQNRFVMLMGEPGTGKSMLGAALSELLPSGSLKDVLVYPNPDEPNRPRIETVPAGEGQKRMEDAKQQEQSRQRVLEFLYWMAVATVTAVIIYLSLILPGSPWYYLLGGAFLVGFMIWGRSSVLPDPDLGRPKLLIDHAETDSAPFIDATGAHEGALFGDVRHDPYQSGGAQTPPHQLVEVGAIHRAHGGVLYIDEVSTMGPGTQQDLLTAIQEKEFHITGRTPGSSGSMVRTEPVPCDFVLVLAGNLQDLEDMHPALRSRIRGYGYEVLTNHTIEDTPENHRKIAQFVSQEVRKDGKIPHFDPSGVRMILREAHRRSDVEGKLTGRLRDLGGLVRAAGDVARKQDDKVVRKEHVKKALSKVQTLEEQMESRKEFPDPENIEGLG